MQKRVVANWKANLSPDHADEWMQIFLAGYRPRAELEVILVVPFLCLERIAERVKGVNGLSLAAQGVSPYPSGGYTGATPVSWLKGLVRYGLLGHRERRKYFHETEQEIAAQVHACVEVGIVPILCLGDEGLAGMRSALDPEDMEVIIPAHTPDTAVIPEVAQSPGGVEEGLERLGRYFPARPLFYGGGVNSDNAAEIMTLPRVAGIMLGRGCLDPEAFVGTLERISL